MKLPGWCWSSHSTPTYLSSQGGYEAVNATPWRKGGMCNAVTAKQVVRIESKMSF